MADGPNSLRKMFSAAILQIIAVNRSDHHMAQLQPGHGISHAAGFEHIKRLRLACCYVAKRAAARADLAHDHHGGVTLVPAFAQVGAPSLFADGRYLVCAHNLQRFVVARTGPRLDADPVRFRQPWSFGAARLFRVALVGNGQVAGHVGSYFRRA